MPLRLPKPRRQRPTKRALAIVEDLSVSDRGLPEIAAGHSMNVATLARWAARTQNIKLLEQARDLSLLRAALVAARARTEAALSLRHVAMDHKNPETARKACVDLLRLCAPPDVLRPPNPGYDDAEREEVLRGILEKLGSGA